MAGTCRVGTTTSSPREMKRRLRQGLPLPMKPEPPKIMTRIQHSLIIKTDILSMIKKNEELYMITSRIQKAGQSRLSAVESGYFHLEKPVGKLHTIKIEGSSPHHAKGFSPPDAKRKPQMLGFIHTDLRDFRNAFVWDLVKEFVLATELDKDPLDIVRFLRQFSAGTPRWKGLSPEIPARASCHNIKNIYHALYGHWAGTQKCFG